MDYRFTDEQKMFRESVYRYAREEITPLCEEADLKAEFSFEIWNKLKAMGLTGLPFPEELGGQGADIMSCCIAGEALGHAGVDGGTLLGLGAHTYLCGMTIFSFGNEAQKKKYIPGIASGDTIGCMGLTEPSCGSDAAAIQTTAVKKGDKYILNGSKTFITNGPVADVMVVYATVDKAKKHEGITAFIVEKDFPGFSVGKPFHKMGFRASTTSEVFFDDCEVPVENMLGSEGSGWIFALSSVEWDRCTLLSPAVGASMGGLETAAKYANTRRAFDRPIGEFQAVQHKLANMKVYQEVIRLSIYRVASAKDAGQSLNPLTAAVSKMYVGDLSTQIASDAVQIFGGYGFMHEYPVERGFRDAKLAGIGGGTTEVMKMIVSRFVLI